MVMDGTILCGDRTENGWLRIAIEKPFGSDYDTAVTMAMDMQVFKKEEIYRVDHYLGKRGVQQITEFRLANPLYDALLNRDHVRRIEIIMQETEDCRGRTSFYDSYGVIRDILQNHLTELLVLIAMDLPTKPESLSSEHDSVGMVLEKFNLLKQLEFVGASLEG